MKHHLLSIPLLFFLLLPQAPTQNTQTPTPWMKPGTYAQYQFNSTGIAFHNKTIIQFQNKTKATYRWECTNIKNQTATINVSITFTNTKTFTLHNTVQVNVSSREVFSNNATFIGVTFLWGPTNVTDNQKIVLWNKPPDKIEANAKIIGNGDTPQGLQKAYTIQTNGTLSGKPIQIIRLYDVDTGLFIDGYVTDDILLTVTGITYFGLNGLLDFQDTNINLGPSEQPQTTKQQQSNMEITIITCSILITFLVISSTIYKKRKNNHKK